MEYIRSELASQRVIGSSVVVISSGRSFLGNIRLNASCGAITIFDGLTPTGTAVLVIASGTLVLGHEINWIFATGITITTPAANSDYSVGFAKN